MLPAFIYTISEFPYSRRLVPFGAKGRGKPKETGAVHAAGQQIAVIS